MRGGEYLTVEALESARRDIESALRAELSGWKGSVESYLPRRSPRWTLVG
jgi:hypothetical protein